MAENLEPTGATRRLVIGAGLAGAALLSARPAWAQEITVPDFGETLALLESEAGVKLIYARLNFAFSLTLDLAVRTAGAETAKPAPIGELPVLPSERPETSGLFETIAELANAEQREAVLAVLSQREDPLAEGRREALARLLNKVAAGLAEVGVPVGEGPVSQALGACGHVERIAAVTRDTSTNSSFFCKFFPFTVFC